MNLFDTCIGSEYVKRAYELRVGDHFYISLQYKAEGKRGKQRKKAVAAHLDREVMGARVTRAR